MYYPYLTQPNPIIQGKTQSTHLPNNFMYVYG